MSVIPTRMSTADARAIFDGPNRNPWDNYFDNCLEEAQEKGWNKRELVAVMNDDLRKGDYFVRYVPPSGKPQWQRFAYLMEELDKHQNSLRSQTASLQDENVGLRQQVHDWQFILEKNQEYFASLQQENAALRLTLQNKQQIVETYEKDNVELQEWMLEADTQLNQYHDNVVQQQAVKEELEAQNKKHSELLTFYEAEIISLRNRLCSPESSTVSTQIDVPSETVFIQTGVQRTSCFPVSCSVGIQTVVQTPVLSNACTQTDDGGSHMHHRPRTFAEVVTGANDPLGSAADISRRLVDSASQVEPVHPSSKLHKSVQCDVQIQQQSNISLECDAILRKFELEKLGVDLESAQQKAAEYLSALKKTEEELWSIQQSSLCLEIDKELNNVLHSTNVSDSGCCTSPMVEDKEVQTTVASGLKKSAHLPRAYHPPKRSFIQHRLSQRDMCHPVHSRNQQRLSSNFVSGQSWSQTPPAKVDKFVCKADYYHSCLESVRSWFKSLSAVSADVSP